MDKITLKDLSFFGYHGVLEEEKVLGQKFFIDIDLYLDLKEAGLSDNLHKSVSYAEVYEVAKKHCQEKRYDLLEALAENISKEIFKEFKKIKSVKIKIKKPEAPVKGIFEYMGVSIKRSRGDYKDE